MKTRIVKALNKRHDVVYVIQYKGFFGWKNLRPWKWRCGYVSYYINPVLEFTSMEEAEKVLNNYNDIKTIL